MPLQNREREVDIMQKPKISVIMGVYNQWNVTALKNAVRSILDQTWEDFEFIIFDDGSHPDAAKYIKGLADLDSLCEWNIHCAYGCR